MKDIVIDGHEKVSSKCAHSPQSMQADPGRVVSRSAVTMDGSWLCIQGHDPENNNIAVNVLSDVACMLPNLDCVIYDRMCSCMKAASKSHALQSIRYWCIDKFHAHGHSAGCVCSPLVHKRLATRLRAVNTSIAEQTFRWFRGYASTFNTMSRSTHLFYVFLYVQKHNDLVRRDAATYLNPYSTKRQIGLQAEEARQQEILVSHQVFAFEAPFLLNPLLLLEEAIDFQVNASQQLAQEVFTLS